MKHYFSKEWSLRYIYNFFLVQIILHFQKEMNVIMYIIEIKKSKFELFHLNKISIKYEFLKFMFL
jgi:hypothetical protein